MHHLRDQDTTKYTSDSSSPQKVLIIQLQKDREHFSSALVVEQHQKQRLGSSTSGFPVAFVKHIHIKTQPPAKHLQI